MDCDSRPFWDNLGLVFCHCLSLWAAMGHPAPPQSPPEAAREFVLQLLKNLFPLVLIELGVCRCGCFSHCFSLFLFVVQCFAICQICLPRDAISFADGLSCVLYLIPSGNLWPLWRLSPAGLTPSGPCYKNLATYTYYIHLILLGSRNAKGKSELREIILRGLWELLSTTQKD